MVESSPGTRLARSQKDFEARFASFSGGGIERVCDILKRATTSERVMPPTTLFEEGWLLRLALDWFSRNPEIAHPLCVPTGARWYSEALLPTRFAGRSQGKSLAERHTHADGVIGHFSIGQTGAGDLVLEPHASHFVVVEAKLKSGLSKGVKNAPNFDQAARTVACMAQSLCLAQARPERLSRLGFFVVAPVSQITSGKFASELTKESMLMKVKGRVAAFNSKTYDAWFSDWFQPLLTAIEIAVLSWEDVGAIIAAHDGDAGAWYTEFYACCRYYNQLPLCS